ncbi:hypothetical protein [Alicyclobacillus dauci]|uniref:FMN-binding domain-containing protein n=1 Tax=Alicyclobacillus dauci TaxID=1475485 RepID=A0ABY6Z2Y7_9BACL|nr:hypothetical protein [Alicyclobacillus dauci]WAH37253.1 hypothetical protein NZD86_01500 [Alicyclobacillus dauci]
MNKKRIWQGGLVIGVVVLLAYVMFTSIPYSVSKSYDESIYNGGQAVQTVPVKVSGKVYRGVFKTNEFVGKVEIDGKTYSIDTFRDKRAFSGKKSPYPYVGVVTATDSQNYTVTTATISMSGDFNSVVASTDAISKKYGKAAELTVPATSNVGGK